MSSESAALRARMVQNQAMVAALTCGEQSRYNHFVRKFQGDLAKNGTVLRKFFRRAYGQHGTRHLNRFVTGLANKESRRSLTDRGAYCSAASAMFDDLGTLKPGYLSAFADTLPSAKEHGYPVCVERAANDPLDAALR